MPEVLDAMGEACWERRNVVPELAKLAEVRLTAKNWLGTVKRPSGLPEDAAVSDRS